MMSRSARCRHRSLRRTKRWRGEARKLRRLRSNLRVLRIRIAACGVDFNVGYHRHRRQLGLALGIEAGKLRSVYGRQVLRQSRGSLCADVRNLWANCRRASRPYGGANHRTAS